MSIVLPFQRHAASAGGTAAAKAANASKVISSRPFSDAMRTTSAQRFAGMKPRARQVLTVEGGSPRPSETALVPPRPSISESIVTSVIPPKVVRSLRTCQEFATCEATFAQELGFLGSMAGILAIQAKRLIATREALGFASQSDFCREICVEKNVYNPFEKAKRPITVAVARKIKHRFGISLDWTLDGDPAQLPAHLYRKLGQVAA